MLDQTINPDSTKNVIWKRKFVPSSEIKSYVNWGKIGDAMFDQAISLFDKSLKGM